MSNGAPPRGRIDAIDRCGAGRSSIAGWKVGKNESSFMTAPSSGQETWATVRRNHTADAATAAAVTPTESTVEAIT